ncbi:MAG: ATP-binding protein [Actinomycetia bacterium]|nr:ATP-binding protein [Actinomycetes bacterium]
MATIRDHINAKGTEHDPVIHEIAIAKQIIQERKGPLDLLRELLSNAGAREVTATEINISYTMAKEGHVFTVEDDGIGMDYTDNDSIPGRLDKFFGLGLSEIVGIKGDEFSWKGLGSKLAYQSRSVEIMTYHQGGDVIRAIVNEPWESISHIKKPKPQIFRYDPDSDQRTGTKITVIGHPPHSKEEPYSFEKIKNYLQHRTFVGFTHNRNNPPKVILSVMGRTEEIPFGFPELEYFSADLGKGTEQIEETVSKNLDGKSSGVRVHMKGLYTWDDKDYELSDRYFNTGMILSVRGIPYFKLAMRDLGSRALAISNPGEGKCCIIVECDEVQQVMNISRSDLIDDPITNLFKETVNTLIKKVEASEKHRAFRSVAIRRKEKKSAEKLDERKSKLEKSKQPYVVLEDSETREWVLLGTEPWSEGDALNILWKLEAMGKLPFDKFQTLHYSPKGPDLVVHFRETETSDTEKYCVIEAERIFTNYRAHGHHPPQFPKVICWALGTSVKVRVEDTDIRYKKKAVVGDTEVAIYLLKHMPGIKVVTKDKLEDKGLL